MELSGRFHAIATAINLNLPELLSCQRQKSSVAPKQDLLEKSSLSDVSICAR